VHPSRFGLDLVTTDFVTGGTRGRRIGIAEVVSKVKALFQDSLGLLVGFNTFLPKGYKIQVVGVDDLAACFVRDVSLDDDGSR
jgi:hypothetical protein